MQSSQVRNVGLPSCTETKRDVPAWTQDPKIFPLDWFSISRPNIIRQTKEYVSELSKWRNCPKIKTLSKLKAVLKRIMMFLHTHISYIDGKSLLECDLEEDLITLVSLYMDMELRVLLIKKSATSGATTSIGPGTDTDTARNDKLVSDRISYWLYTVLTGHEQRVDALLSTTVYTRHTRPVLDPIFRKVLSEMPDGPFSNFSYVRNMLAYKTWRERTLVADDEVSEELNARILQQLVPRDYAFPSPLLRCLGKGENARDHARPHNVNLADACRNFMRYCREIPATAAEQINFESIPLLDDEMLGDEENEVNNLMNMISNRKQRKTASVSPRNSIQVDAFIDLTLPKSKSVSSRSKSSASVAAVIDLTEEDEKPVITTPTSVVVEPSATAPSRVAPAVQRVNTSKKPQTSQDCSYALTPSAPQVVTRCFTAYRDQDIYLVKFSSMCPVRAHKQRECQCQDKKSSYYKDNKPLKTCSTERKYEKDATFVGRDATFVGGCFQFSIDNQYAYPSEDDVDTELEPLVVGNSQDQVKLEMRSSAAVTCNTNGEKPQEKTTEFCDKLFSSSINHCDCDGCKRRDTNLSRCENRTSTSEKTCDESAIELSDNIQCRQKPLVTCTQRVQHPNSVADIYAMEKTNPIVLQSQQSVTLSGNESNVEHFSETLDKRKVQCSEIQNNKISKDNFVQNTDNLSSSCLNKIRKIKLPVVDKLIDDRRDKFEPPVLTEDIFPINSNTIMPTNSYEETVECRNVVIPNSSEENLYIDNPRNKYEKTTEYRKSAISRRSEETSNNTTPTNIYEETMECRKLAIPRSNEETSNTTIPSNTYEKATECSQVRRPFSSIDTSNNTISINTYEETTVIPHSSDENSNNSILSNTYEDTKCSKVQIPNSSEDTLNNTIPTNTYEETTEYEKVVIAHSNDENLNSSMPANKYEETAECKKDVIPNSNEETSSSIIPINTFKETTECEMVGTPYRSEKSSNTYEEKTKCEKVVIFHSSEEDSNVMPTNTDEETIESREVLISHCSEENFAQSTHEIATVLSNENIKHQNTFINDIEVHTENTNITAENTSNDTSTFQQQISFLPNAQNESLLPKSNSETEFEKLCNEITELGCSVISDNNNPVEKDSNVIRNEEFLQNDLLEETYSVLQSNETMPDITTVNIERNLELISENSEQTHDVSIPNIQTSVEIIAENNYEYSCIENSNSSAELKENEIEHIEETTITTEESAAKEEITNEKNSLEIENVLPDYTNTVNQVKDNFEEYLTPEGEIVVEAEIVVESVPEIPDTTHATADNQLGNVELSFGETNTITQDLSEVVTGTVNYTDSDDVDLKPNSIRKRRTSIVSDVEKNEVSINLKNDKENISNLSPHKRRRRTPDLNTNEVTDEDKHEQYEVMSKEETFLKVNNFCDHTSDNSKEEKCISHNISADNLLQQPEIIKYSTTELEDTQNITIPHTSKDNYVNNKNLPILSEEILSNVTKPNDIKYQHEAIIEDVGNVQSSEAEKPKRRRKQNLKNIREEKLTSLVDITENNLTIPQKQIKIVCKNLSQNEIENFRKNKSQTLPEINSKLILTAEQDTTKIELNLRDQESEDNSTSNCNIEKLSSALDETKYEKSKTDLNAENNEANIENLKDTSQSLNKGKQKQRTIKIKSRRKAQLVDNISDKIENNMEDQVTNSTLKSVETLPITKIKRPRGRPSKVASNKTKFFSENFNLQNLNTITKNSSNNDVGTTLGLLNIPEQSELSDEDVPLARRVCQSVPQKRNSLKSSNKILNKIRLSDIENELVKSEDELPLTARKQKIKSTKHSKNCSTNSSESIAKPKSFREKLEKFKFQARDKTETIVNTQIKEEESEIFTLKKFNTDNKSKKYVKTYSNRRALKTQKIFSVPDIETSTVKPSKSCIQTSPVKPKKSLKFSSEVTTYGECNIDNFSNIPEATKNINTSKQLISTDSNIERSKKIDSALHRAEQIKIKKFREISDKTDLLSYENKKITDIKDNISSEEKITNKTKENKNNDKSTDLMKSSTCNEEIKHKLNFNFVSKKMLSKKAREKLFPDQVNVISSDIVFKKLDTVHEIDENCKEKETKIVINNTNVETSFAENIPSFTDTDNKLQPESSLLKYKENKNVDKTPFDVRKNNEEELLNIKEKENALDSPISLKTPHLTKIDTQTSCSKEENEQDCETIIFKNIPKKRKSKFPKLKLNLSKKNSSPKKLHNNIDSSPKGTRFKKNNKIQLRLNGSNNKTKKRTSKRICNKIETNVNALRQDTASSLCKDLSQDSNNDSLKYTRTQTPTLNRTEENNDLLNQNVQITTKNISSVTSTLSTEKIIMESDKFNSLKKVEDKTNNFPEKIESANVTGDMLYKPSNKVYEKNFEFYSDQDDVSNSELVIDTSAESSDAEDTKVEGKLEEDQMNHQIEKKVPDLKQSTYHHSIAEIVNVTSVENSTTDKDKTHNITQDYINPTAVETIEQIVVYQSKNDVHQQEDIQKSDEIDSKNSKFEEIELTILFRESPKKHNKEINFNDEIHDPSLISVSEETNEENNSKEQVKDVVLCPPTSDESINVNNTFLEGMKQTVLFEETSIKHQEESLSDNICDSSISIAEETVLEEKIVDELHFANEDHNSAVFEKNKDIQNTMEEKPSTYIQNKNVVEEHTAEITEMSEEIYNEFHIENIIEEKALQLSEPYGPSVEMFMNIEIGYESYTKSQIIPLQGEHAKEGCVKCSVNGKHKDNKRVKVQGTHQYKENNIEECSEENAVIPAIPYCQAVENFEPNLCIFTAKVEYLRDTMQILINDSPVPVEDNYNLCILADIAMSSTHLNTKTENNNVIEMTAGSSNDIQNQGPLQKDERCIFVTYPENVPTSNKSGTDISVINSNNEQVSVNVQKLAEGLNAKGILIENKIQVLTERAKNGNKKIGENFHELCKSLENMCELQINTLTRSPPKSESQNNTVVAPFPIEIPPVNPKIHEPNITIDIPNTAHLHLSPDDDDFMIRNEPFSLQLPVVQPLESIEAPAVLEVENKGNINTTIVKNLCNELDSLTTDQKILNSENENCESPKETEQVTKSKSKNGRSKSKSFNNQKSEASYLLNKYKSNQDSNKNVDTCNKQKSNSNKNNKSSPPSYIRSTRPMRMVTTKKRNINVLDNNCPPDEPAKKISASEKMFDKLLEEHRKELSESKLQNTKEETIVDKNVEIVHTASDTTMPVLDDIPETNVPLINAEESNIPLSVLQYEHLKNEEQVTPLEPIKLDTSNTAEKLEVDTFINDCKNVNKKELSEEKIVEEKAPEIPLANEIELVNDNTQSEDPSINIELSNQTEISEEINNTCAETQIEKNTEELIVEEEVNNTADRVASAIEVVQDWFEDNKAQSVPYTDIKSIQTIEEYNFFEEISSTSENSPNARKNEEEVFSEHQTPDSGIAFDEDSVQKDKSIRENLSDGETYSPTEPAKTKTYFCNLDQSGSVQQIEISDLKIVKPTKSCEINNGDFKVSIALEKIKEILPLLTKYKVSTPERKLKKRKEYITDNDKGKKRKHSSEETNLNIVCEQSSNNTLIKDYKFKRRKHSDDEHILQECVIEDVMSPATNQRDIPSSIRTKGSVKEYPDCLFGSTESPVPSGSFHSPYPSDISITEEPTFYEEGGIDLCSDDYPCYDSFEVLQEQQSQREYSVVDENPKDVQQDLQAGYCVVDSQFLPLSEYMNDGDYILIGNKIINDKRMVLVNMHQVQPETKPHNSEEVKRSEFDDSEKEDSLSETVDEIIKNPSLFSEQSASEVQVISMDQATSEVQVVIACENYQETDMTDTYLLDIAMQSDTPSTSGASDIQHTAMDLEETSSENKVIDKSVELTTPKEDAQFCNISALSLNDVPPPASMELLAAVNSISGSVVTQDILENKEKLANTCKTGNVSSEKTKKCEKMNTGKLSTEEPPQIFFKSQNSTSNLTTQSQSIENSSKTFQTSNLKSSNTLSYEKGSSDSKEVNSKEQEPKVYNSKTPDKNLSPLKDQKKYDYQHGVKINPKNTYPGNKPHVSIQKPSKITSHVSPPVNQRLNESKVHLKQFSPKTYRSKVPADAFDKLKQDRIDITPPDSRTRYHSSNSDQNFTKNRDRKDTATDYHRRHSFVRNSPRLKNSSQGPSDSRRSQSAYTEPSPKPSYRLPPSDPTHRSSQYNNKKPDTKSSQSRTDHKHSQSASSAHRDWLKNETLLNLIKTANTIYSKKY